MVGLDQCPLLVGRQEEEEEEAWERGGGEGATTVISVFENTLIVSIIVTMFHNVMKGYVSTSPTFGLNSTMTYWRSALQ